MKVQELRHIVNRFKEKIACDHLKLLHKQKLGYTYHQVFNSRSRIMDDILADALLKANNPLLETDTVRLPAWLDQLTFSSFIAKLNLSW